MPVPCSNLHRAIVGYGTKHANISHPAWFKRQSYVAENFAEIRKDIAHGGGEDLDTLQFLSGYPASSKVHVSHKVHKSYELLLRREKLTDLASACRRPSSYQTRGAVRR